MLAHGRDDRQRSRDGKGHAHPLQGSEQQQFHEIIRNGETKRANANHAQPDKNQQLTPVQLIAQSAHQGLGKGIHKAIGRNQDADQHRH